MVKTLFNIYPQSLCFFSVIIPAIKWWPVLEYLAIYPAFAVNGSYYLLEDKWFKMAASVYSIRRQFTCNSKYMQLWYLWWHKLICISAPHKCRFKSLTWSERKTTVNLTLKVFQRIWFLLNKPLRKTGSEFKLPCQVKQLISKVGGGSPMGYITTLWVEGEQKGIYRHFCCSVLCFLFIKIYILKVKKSFSAQLTSQIYFVIYFVIYFS